MPGCVTDQVIVNSRFAENKCVLGCFIKGTGLGFAFGNVVDGTDCEKNSIDKCIEGQCTVSS